MNPRNPGQRAGLERSSVLAAGRELLEREGADGLTMRRLAARLGVTPNALYSHVESKAALVDEILDGVLAEVAPPAKDTTAASGLQELMESTLEVLLAHRELVPLYLARQGARGPNARNLGRVMENLLSRTRLSKEATADAIHLLIIYTIGFAAFAGRSLLLDPSEQPLDGPELSALFVSGLASLLRGLGIED